MLHYKINNLKIKLNKANNNPNWSLGRQMGWMVGEKMKFFSMITTATSMVESLAKAGCA